MSEKPHDMEGKCSRCGSEFMGRATDKWLEKQGWRRVGGKWVCNFCTGIGIPGAKP